MILCFRKRGRVLHRRYKDGVSSLIEVGEAEREQADLEELRKAYRKYQRSNSQKDFDAFIRTCDVILK